MMTKALAIQARDALYNDNFDKDTKSGRALIAALQAQIDAPEPEPMFWVRLRSDGCYEGPIHNDGIERVRKLSGVWSPLYTHPPAVREPLTDEQIEEIAADNSLDTIHAVARAIEAAVREKP